METKKVIGTFIVALGVLGLTGGILGIFEGFQLAGISPWALAILGLIFFSSGIGLLRSIRPPKTREENEV